MINHSSRTQQREQPQTRQQQNNNKLGNQPASTTNKTTTHKTTRQNNNNKRKKRQKIMIHLLWKRALLSLSTIPTAGGWYQVAGITLATTVGAGVVATSTGFVHPLHDFHPPSSLSHYWKPCSAFLVPSLVQEIIWRGMFIPRNNYMTLVSWMPWFILVLHVLSHPVAAQLVWPRGRSVFGDVRFLLLATIVLGGATTSYIVTGGSVWAATVTHGIPVALWRDFFKGEERLSLHHRLRQTDNNNHQQSKQQQQQQQQHSRQVDP